MLIERMTAVREGVLAIAAIGGVVWAILRFVFEPHVHKTVRAIIAETMGNIPTRLKDVEDAVNDLRRDGQEQDTALHDLRAEMRQGFDRLTIAVERIAESSAETSRAVARLEGRLEGDSR